LPAGPARFAVGNSRRRVTPSVEGRLREAAQRLRGERIALGELAEAHGPAAQGTLLVLTALPCMLPVPGTGSVLGWGLAAMALAMWRGHDFAQLPSRLGRFAMPLPAARRTLNVAATFYRTAGRYARECRASLAGPGHRRWVALLVALMALLIVLPIPFGNLLPALAVILFGLGQVFRDGLLMLAGAATSAAALAFCSAIVGWACWQGARWFG
jgi:hypothetical protein